MKKKIMIKYIFILCIFFLSCTNQNQRNDKTQTIPSNDINITENNTAKPLIIGGKQYYGPIVGYSESKECLLSDIDSIEHLALVIDPLDPTRIDNLDGIEQLFEAKKIQSIYISIRNIDKFDLSQLEQFRYITELRIRGNDCILPDFNIFVSLNSLSILDKVFENYFTLKIPPGLNYLTLNGTNLHKVDLSTIESLYELTGLRIEGDITRLPDLTKLEKLSFFGVKNARLESLEGIGAPNARWIEINGVREIDSLAPLNNLPFLENLTVSGREDLVVGGRSSTTLRIADMSNLPSLKKLGLFMNAKIDLQGIDKLSALEELSVLWRQESFNIEGIRKLENLWQLFLKLVSPEPSLEFLRDMPNLSDLGLIGNVEFLDSYPIQTTEPYQILDVSPLASLKNLRNLSCTDFIIKNIAALDVLDTLSIENDESRGYIDLTGCKLYDETEKSRHPLVLERPVK